MPPHVRPDPNQFEADFGSRRLYGRITALEGQGGLMRLQLNAPADPAPDALAVGDEGVLQLHDGARFRVVVLEPLPGDALSYRVRLVTQEPTGRPD